MNTPVNYHRREASDYAGNMFELHLRTESVVILTERKGGWDVFESVDAGRLFRELIRCGREKIRVRGMVCERGALDHRSLQTLNCFLRHNPRLAAFANVSAFNGTLHRHSWTEFQRFLGLRWAA